MELSCRKLSRAMLYVMLRYGAKLERKQMAFFRFVDIGAELFAMTASCVRAQMLVSRRQNGAGAVQLADHFCGLSRRRVDDLFRSIFRNDDAQTYHVSQQVMRGEHLWLEAGIVGPYHALKANLRDLEDHKEPVNAG